MFLYTTHKIVICLLTLIMFHLVALFVRCQVMAGTEPVRAASDCRLPHHLDAEDSKIIRTGKLHTC